MNESCPACDGPLRDKRQVQHRHGAVLRLARSTCDACGWEGVTPVQSRCNKEALVATRKRYVADIVALIGRSECVDIAIGHSGFSATPVHPDLGRGSTDVITGTAAVSAYVTEVVRELATMADETALCHIDVVRPGVILRR